MSQSKFIFTTLGFVVILLLLFIADISFGSINLLSISKNDPLFSTIIFDIRLPKAITAIITGSGLALCGLLMQSLFRNPLAGPYALGISSGSGLFVAIATIMVSTVSFAGHYFMGKSIVILFAILGALLVTLIILWVAQRNKSNVTVLLVGLMLSQIFGAIQGLIEYLGNAENIKTFIVWGMGNIGSTTLSDLSFIIPVYFVVVLYSFTCVKSLNAILLSEQYAINLGINIKSTRIRIIIICAILVGLITAYCGPIAFVGISVPIASRLFFKTAHHLHQIVFCLLLGAIVVLVADILCQLLSHQFALPLNTVTTIIGSPIVIYLLFKSKFSIS